MNRASEKKIVKYCLENLLKRPSLCRSDNLYNWFEEFAPLLYGIEVESLWQERWKRDKDPEKLPRHYKSILKLLDGKPAELVIDKTVAAIIEAFHIAPQYHDILALRIYGETIHSIGRLLATQPDEYKHHATASMVGLTAFQYEKHFSTSSELVEKGLFKGRFNYHSEWTIETTQTLQDILYAHCRTVDDVRRTILGKPLKGILAEADYDYIADEYSWMKNLLRNSVAKKEKGVNVIIYGKPGTGKSELAKSICRDIGASLFFVSSESRNERHGRDRRSDLAAGLCLMQGSDDSVLLMDEAEDVFDAASGWNGPLGMRHESKPSKSKLFFNTLLETNTVPVIWISNSIRGVDPAHLRRFTYALNLESPSETVQARIWTSSARRNKVKISKTKIDELVRTYDLAPAIINVSVRAVALTNDESAIEKTVDSLQTAMHGRVTKKEKTSKIAFSPALLNCDTDLENLTERVLGLKDESFSLCLYGEPGTGKSEYARYLAEKLTMKVLQKRASDLFGPYVGETEEHIAGAFAEARRNRQLLIFDEADSFLRDRRGAHRSWEVTQVNEMLTQMENHPLPFVCTTNLMEGLDKASLRRFTFKVKYDFLTASQVKTAFVHFFGKEPTTKLDMLTHIVPGDFAVVAKRAKICGIEDHRELCKMLREEQSVKNVKEKQIGFITGE